MGNAKDYAIANGVDVINMSGGFYITGDGSGNGTGIFAFEARWDRQGGAQRGHRLGQRRRQ